MKFDLVKDELSNLLEELMEQFHTIDSHEKAIPQIEMDIFMRNIQKLYENTVFLNKIKESKSQLSPPINKEENPIINKEQPVEEKIEEASIDKPQELIAQELDQLVVVKEEQVKEKIKIEAQDDLALLMVKEETQATHKETIQEDTIQEETIDSIEDILEEKSETDLFSTVKPSDEINDLNKKLADARNTHSIVEKLQNNRIESLKSVIGINDKFYFINELFGGDTQKYEDIIYTLNNFKKLEDAMQYFSTLKYRFAWDEESEPYAKLTHMLERKFNLIDA